MENPMPRPEPAVPLKTRSLGRNMAERLDPFFNKFVHHDEDGGVTLPKFLHQFPSTFHHFKESIDKRKSPKKLGQLLKAVWFETSLAKKMKNKKSTNEEQQEPNGSVVLEEQEEVEKESNTTPSKPSDNLPPEGSFPPISPVKPAKNTNFSLRHSFSSPSLHSSFGKMDTMLTLTLPPIQPNPYLVKYHQQKQQQQQIHLLEQQKQTEEMNQQAEDGKGSHSTNWGLCLILVTLMVLVLWGKACAILCTSTWLFLVPLFLHPDQKRSPSYRNGFHGQEFDTLEFRKKIIMEGLLDKTDHISPFMSNE